MSRRREFTRKIKVAAFERAQGRCEDCAAKLMPGRIEYDHRIPDALGGDPTLENCVVLCSTCHGAKTAGEDVPRIAKMKRIRDKHVGAKAPSKHKLPGSKDSPWKQKVGGTWVPR